MIAYHWGGATENIKSALGMIIQDMQNNIASTKSLGEALEMIVKEYKKTDELVAGNCIKATKSYKEHMGPSSSGTGTDKGNRGFFERLIDWIFNTEPDPRYEATSEDDENNHNYVMKRSLWEVLSDDKYSEDKWVTYTIDEKKALLQEYAEEVIIIFGLKDVEHTIEWNSSLNYSSKSVNWGRYNHATHKIILNENVLSDTISWANSYTLIQTVSHECRHAYQYEAIDYPEEFMVTQEIIEEWDYNLYHDYIQFGDPASVKMKWDYESQPVEKDARDFEITRDMRFY